MVHSDYSRISKFKFAFALFVAFTVFISVPSLAKAEDNRGREEQGRESRNDDRDNHEEGDRDNEREDRDEKGNKRCKRNGEHKDKCKAKEVPEFSTITGLLTAGLSTGSFLFLKKRPF